jgi:hypothetical protein
MADQSDQPDSKILDYIASRVLWQSGSVADLGASSPVVDTGLQDDQVVVISGSGRGHVLSETPLTGGGAALPMVTWPCCGPSS